MICMHLQTIQSYGWELLLQSFRCLRTKTIFGLNNYYFSNLLSKFSQETITRSNIFISTYLFAFKRCQISQWSAAQWLHSCFCSRKSGFKFRLVRCLKFKWKIEFSPIIQAYGTLANTVTLQRVAPL